MLVDDWERLFSPAILSRGYDYFADDRITRLKALSDGWEATASGSMDYSVFIDEGLERASCTCPYFKEIVIKSLGRFLSKIKGIKIGRAYV